MRKWLARLGFSFIIIAAACAWEGYRTQRGERGPGRERIGYAYFAAAALLFGLGLRGVRERHRLIREQEEGHRRDDPSREG